MQISDDVNAEHEKNVSVKKVRFPDFSENIISDISAERKNIGLLRNVVVEIKACTGSTKITLGDLIKLSEGSVIELDPSDLSAEITAEFEQIASGDIVVKNNRFGVRITEIPESL